MNIENLTDFSVKVLLPLLTLVGGWFANAIRRKRSKHKDRAQLIDEFQASNDTLFKRLHEMQMLDLEAASKNALLLKQNASLKIENSRLQEQIIILNDRITELEKQLKSKA
jgi:predicted nuclease with TOPRIM domain